MPWVQVGTVELLRERVYPLDEDSEHGGLFATMVVAPGTYPVLRQGDSVRWVMSGRASVPQIDDDDVFATHSGDRPVGDPVEFPSPTYSLAEFEALLADPVCLPGPVQQLRFDLTASIL